jgi:transcriptional regulator with XRE-family HTH domain
MPTISPSRDLELIRDAFGLSKSELADLLHRRPQSVLEWEQRGIPQEIRATVERLADLARVFKRELRPSRIPEIVRTPDAWLGGRTILDVLRADGVDPVYAYLARLFRYAG